MHARYWFWGLVEEGIEQVTVLCVFSTFGELELASKHAYQSPCLCNDSGYIGIYKTIECDCVQVYYYTYTNAVCRFQLFSMNVRYNVWYSTHCAVFRTAVSIRGSVLGTKLSLLLGLIITIVLIPCIIISGLFIRTILLFLNANYVTD